MSDLGSFGGPQGSGYAINDLGHVAGWAARDIWGNAFLYKDGIMHNLGTLGGSGSEAFGLNNNDQVVGVSYTAGGTEHAFIYHAGSMYDLNNLLATSLPTTLWKATDINESGQIVAWGEDSRSYLLTPIPEPTSIALVLLGIAATLVRRKART